jgi:hypothetical protein
MSKPTTLPRWATGGSALVTEPNEAKKDAGWLVSEKPPAQFFNWLFTKIYAWLAFLDAMFASDGLKRIQTAADLTALKALTPADGDVCQLADGAQLRFVAGATTAADDATVVQPAVTAGRWFHVGYGLRGAAKGLASLDASKTVIGTAAASSNAPGVNGTGDGTGAGVKGTGLAAAPGVYGTGGPTNGRGLEGHGAASGVGVYGQGGTSGPGGAFVGGSTSGTGVQGTAVAGNSKGVVGAGNGTAAGVAGTGGATGPGVTGSGGATNGNGVEGTGVGASHGVTGQGGATGGDGVRGTGGATNGPGVRGVGGATNGVGVLGQGTGTGAGVYGQGGTSGPGGTFEASTPRGAINIPPSAQPTTPVDGDIYLDSTSGKLCFYLAGWHTVTSS